MPSALSDDLEALQNFKSREWSLSWRFHFCVFAFETFKKRRSDALKASSSCLLRLATIVGGRPYNRFLRNCPVVK